MVRDSAPPPGGGRPGGGTLLRRIAAWALVLSAALTGCMDSAQTRGEPVQASARGEQLFKERCAACHPNGSNIINPKKTLHRRVLADYGITAPADIVKKIRNPGPGMTRFDEATITDADARLIAEYILATYR